MKASLKFRDDQKPLFRAKVPLHILGFPFQSGVSAGDSKELSLNLSTFFESGPSLKLIYRPNDSWNPFSLVVKTGIGPFGSPISAPLSMSAEFNLVGGAVNRNPSFFLRFSPQIGDFSIKKSSSSPIAISKLRAADLDSDADESVDGVQTESPLVNGVVRLDNGNGHGSLFGNKRVNGMITGSNAVRAIDSLVNGVEVSARTVLPVRNRAVLKCRWGVKFPPELKTGMTEEGTRTNPMAGISFKKFPFLVMSKIAIEHVAEDVGKEKAKELDQQNGLGFGGSADVAEACLGVKRQLQSLQVENGLLRKAVEELRSEIGVGKFRNEGKGSEFGGFAGKGMGEDVHVESKA